MRNMVLTILIAIIVSFIFALTIELAGDDTERLQKRFIENNDGQLCYGTEESCNEQFNKFGQGLFPDTVIEENRLKRIAETERWIIRDLNNSLNIIDINEKPTFRIVRKGGNITHHIESKEKKNFNIGNYELITTRDQLSNTNPEDWNLNQYKALEQSINLNGKKEIWINEKDGFIALRDIRVNTVQTDIIYQSKPTEDGTKITVTRTKYL